MEPPQFYPCRMITRSDWDRFRSYKIKPTLSMTAADKGITLKSKILDKKAGVMEFITKKKVPAVVFLRLTGEGPRAKIKTTVFAKQKSKWIKYNVQRKTGLREKPKRPPSEEKVDVDIDSILNSCKSRGLDKRRCLKLANRVGEKKSTKLFGVCANNTRQTRQFSRCVAFGSQLKSHTPFAVI